MSLFPIVDGRARFDASGNVASDRYAAGIRFTQEGAARSQTSAGTNFNQGIPMSESGQVSLVDASSGLPADVVWLSGLPISGNRVCISNKPVSVVSSGIPYDSAGAVAATVAPITTLPTLDLVFAGTATDPLDAATTADDTLGLNFVSQAYQIAAQYAVWGTGGLQQVNFADIVTFTRASTATYFDSTGTLQTATTNTARFDYNPATLAAQGLLIEEQRTNLLLQSADFTTSWGTTGVTIVGNVTASPDGGTNGDSLTVNVAGNATNQTSQTFTAGSTITVSVFAKKNTSNFLRIEVGNLVNCWFDLNTGVTGTSNAGSGNVLFSAKSIQAISNGWYRCVLTVTTTTITTLAVLLFPTNADSTSSSVNSSVFLWGAQAEVGAFPTSYIPTTTTALTRSADVASVNTLSPWFNETEGTLFAECVTSNGTVVAGFGETFANTSYITRGASSNISIRSGGSDQAVLTAAFNATLNAINRVAYAYKANDFAATANGAAATTDISGAVPLNQLRLKLGSSAWDTAGTNNLNGYLRRITYYPRRLPNADLQTITA